VSLTGVIFEGRSHRAARELKRYFAVRGLQGGLVTATHGVIYNNTIIVTPTNAFHAGEVVMVNASSQIENSSGLTLTIPYAWQFTIDARNGDGNGNVWWKNTVTAALDEPASVYAADVDGDGDLDVLGAAGTADDITWWENTNGDGTAWTEHTVAAAFDGAVSVYAADVDSDGDLDVLGAAIAADDITWWENTNGDGTAWTEHTVAAAFDGAVSVYAADVDSDGDLDVLGAAITADDITWWENTNGDGTAWTEHTVAATFDGASSVYAADVDRDGDLDILGAAGTADDITWWENTNGDGTAWTEHAVATAFDAARSVYAADVDGDGDLDVLGAASFANDITWWENTNGDGTAWTEHTVATAFDGAWSMYAADVDGDGDLDVLGAALFADDITWWENTNGDGTAWTEHTVAAAFDGASSVYAADVDGDSDLDILGAASIADEIQVWLNVPPPDLSIVKTVNPSDAAPGKTITYTLTFSNASGGIATGVVITDSIPVSVTNVNVVSSGVAITNTGATPAYVWNVQNLTPGDEGIITITAQISSSLAVGTFTNTAIIRGTDDINLANNDSDAAVTVVTTSNVVYLPIVIKQ
jgi:uncharacterized repeat protein (TIGR01451 family)